MARKERRLQDVFQAGLFKENPVLRLVLGICPTLAVTTTASNGLGMGIVTAMVLICSNTVISMLRKVIPEKVRIPAYITLIASIVSILQMFVSAYAPGINEELGIFLPLIAVSCIILGRAESFARKNKVLPSILDALGMGIGFTGVLLLMGSIREVLGMGTWFGHTINNGVIFEPMLLFILPPGGFLVFGFLIAMSNKMAIKKGKEPVDLTCDSCPVAKNCRGITEGGC